jgi:hypothetical protein
MRNLIFAALLALQTTVTFAATSLPIDRDQPEIPKTAFSTDASDLWWNPAESGWGMQMVQEADTVYATLFIYGSDGRPTWLTAPMRSAGGPTFSGPLYVTNGPSFAGVFNPSAVLVRQVGTMTVSFQSVQTALLTYSVDGVQVTKQIERETLAFENFSGSYVVGIRFQASQCYNPSNNGVLATGMAIGISQTGSNMSSIFYFPNGLTCTYSGTYEQSGHMGALTGNFTCTTGEVGQMRLFELTNRPGIISGRMRGTGTNTGCQYTGFFSGIDPSQAPR